MNKKIIFIVGLIILAGVLFWAFQSGFFTKKTETTIEPTGIILFYGDGCPHCAFLDKWITDNGVEGKVSFTKLEVYNNQANQKLLVEKATVCGIATDSIGVPFLWTGTDCLVGDEPIEQFFEQKLNINESTATNETNEIIQ